MRLGEEYSREGGGPIEQAMDSRQGPRREAQGEEESKARDRARGCGEEGSEREECRMVRRGLVQGQGLGILIQC